MQLMTFNLRVLTPIDGPNHWIYRRNAVGSMLRERQVELLGLQEATRPQIDDVADRLPTHAWVGLGRQGGDDGEFCPIFYRIDRFDLLASGHFWVAEDTDSPGLGWDAEYVRISTWARLRHRPSGKTLVILNTHLDNRGITARAEGAKLNLRRLAELSAGGPAVLMGDFNCSADCEPYCATVNGPLGLRDARRAARAGHAGPIETFTGYRGSGIRPRLIDYIFTSPHFAILRTETLPDDLDGRQLSDHRALQADVELSARSVS